MWKPNRQVGDRVMIKSESEIFEIQSDSTFSFRHVSFVQSMLRFCGQSVTINEILAGYYSHSDDDPVYRIKEDSGDFVWSDWMFEQDFECNPDVDFDALLSAQST